MPRKTWMVLAIIFVVLALITQITRYSMMASAQRDVDEITIQLRQAEKNLDQLQSQLKAAKKKHLAIYLKDFSYKGVDDSLKKAAELVDKANKADDPNSRREMARRAERLIFFVRPALADRSAYLKLLDAALENYKEAPNKVAKSCAQVNDYIGKLEHEGYFSQHFSEPLRLITVSMNLRKQAWEVSMLLLDGQHPDYLKVFVLCQDGERRVAEARQLTQAVPATRMNNAKRLEDLSGNIAKVRQLYNSARAAAINLERYPKYRSLQTVDQAKLGFPPIEALGQSAEQQNSMVKQEFTLAAQTLSSAESKLSGIEQTFSTSIEHWEKIQTAIAYIPYARNQAESAINKANDYIESYSYNSQGDAEDLLDQARQHRNEGDGLRYSDPPESYDAYEKAERLANQAYDAVNTSSRHSSSDDASYRPGGGSSPTGGGYGGGGMGGGSSPTGGGYGGPTGGGYGGPGGGESGTGGF